MSYSNEKSEIAQCNLSCMAFVPFIASPTKSQSPGSLKPLFSPEYNPFPNPNLTKISLPKPKPLSKNYTFSSKQRVIQTCADLLFDHLSCSQMIVFCNIQICRFFSQRTFCLENFFFSFCICTDQFLAATLCDRKVASHTLKYVSGLEYGFAAHLFFFNFSIFFF